MSKMHQPKYQRLLKKLRQARLDVGLTQVQVGEKLKQPQVYVSKIERGERSVDALELAEFAKIYKKPVSFFLS
jgi:transcriptional regulator with XRE-family HTH domain